MRGNRGQSRGSKASLHGKKPFNAAPSKGAYRPDGRGNRFRELSREDTGDDQSRCCSLALSVFDLPDLLIIANLRHE